MIEIPCILTLVVGLVLFTILGGVLSFEQKIQCLLIWFLFVAACSLGGAYAQYKNYGSNNIFLLTDKEILFLQDRNSAYRLPLATLDFEPSTWSHMWGFTLISGNESLEIPFETMLSKKRNPSHYGDNSELKEFSQFFDEVISMAPQLKSRWETLTNLSTFQYLAKTREELSI